MEALNVYEATEVLQKTFRKRQQRMNDVHAASMYKEMRREVGGERGFTRVSE